MLVNIASVMKYLFIYFILFFFFLLVEDNPVFLFMVCKNSLYIMDTSSLLDMCFATIFFSFLLIFSSS